MRRIATALAILLLLAVAAFFFVLPRMVDASLNSVVDAPSYEVSPDIRALYDTLLVADMHADMLLWSRDPLRHHNHGHVDVPRLLEANVTLATFAAVTKSPAGQNYVRNRGDTDRITALAIAQRWPMRTWGSLLARALYQAQRLDHAAANAGGRLVVVRSRGDLDRLLHAREQGEQVVGGLLAIEGLHAMEGEIENLDLLVEAGYRMMSFAHFFDTDLGGSAHGSVKGGITPLGEAVQSRMDSLGIIMDLAHVSPATFRDVVERTSRPVVVSHGGVQATCAGPRNLTDDQLRAVAGSGGVVGIGFWAGAVCDASPAGIARAIRHAVDVAGVEHVGLGSDFDGTIHAAFDVTGLPLLIDALQREGFGPTEISLIMGENVARVYREVLR